eukprot:TRINITY_DN23035_c0_g1_i1.p1 TRINITY_DN23035_c0_g1~~TRINITY_DN23035_c0_g1_i1.p1  ORF type:complete len:131 (+),score=29.70 TRINITY_DN23035_c0_g1_i1:40-393(+)
MALATGHTRWMVIDTDAGIDDAVALCMALKLARRYGFELKLITACFGNTTVDQVCVNVAKCLVACCPKAEDLKGTTPLIVRGASCCFAGEAIHASHFHGKDGLGDAGGREGAPGASP